MPWSWSKESGDKGAGRAGDGRVTLAVRPAATITHANRTKEAGAHASCRGSCCSTRLQVGAVATLVVVILFSTLLMTMCFGAAGQISSYLWYNLQGPVGAHCQVSHEDAGLAAPDRLDLPATYSSYLDVIAPPPQPAVVEDCAELLEERHYPPRYRHCRGVKRSVDKLRAPKRGVLLDRCVLVNTAVFLQFGSCVLAEARIPHNMEHGTLLSAVRGSWVVPWGLDADIQIMQPMKDLEPGGYPGMQRAAQWRAAGDAHIVEAYAQFGGTTFQCADGSGRMCTGGVRGAAQRVGGPRYDVPTHTMTRLVEAFERYPEHVVLQARNQSVVPLSVNALAFDVMRFSWQEDASVEGGYTMPYERGKLTPADHVDFFPSVPCVIEGVVLPCAKDYMRLLAYHAHSGAYGRTCLTDIGEQGDSSVQLHKPDDACVDCDCSVNPIRLLSVSTKYFTTEESNDLRKLVARRLLSATEMACEASRFEGTIALLPVAWAGYLDEWARTGVEPTPPELPAT